MIDQLILFAVGLVIGLMYSRFFADEAVLFGISMLATAAYQIATPVLFGAHIGKLAFGYRIVDAAGRRLSWKKAFLRYLGTYVSGVVIGMGYLAVAFDDRKQGWHDKIAGTFVVKASQMVQ